jgi:hypothetical protein
MFMTLSLNLVWAGAYRVCLPKQESGSLWAMSFDWRLKRFECLRLIKNILLYKYLFHTWLDAKLVAVDYDWLDIMLTTS